MQVATMGVYGFSEDKFFDSLLEAGVTTICDVRARRGMRGRTYAFANSTALQRRLAECGIKYVHRRDLAPSVATRAIQRQVDRVSQTLKRDRTSLSSAFVRDYERERLASLDTSALLMGLGAGTIAFLCVEGEPSACHRSILAEYVARSAGLSLKHIVP